MTALDDYLAREQETLRAATPRPWPNDYVYEAVRHIARNCDFESVVQPDFMWDRYNDADLIVSAVNDREALLDAVELLAEMTEWLWHARSTPTEPCDEGCEACKDQRRIQSVLSRLTADSEGVGT